MTRAEVKRRLALAWWQYLAVGLVPLPVMAWAFGGGDALIPVLAMPLFIAGAATMFLSLPRFGAYKRALIATSKVLGTGEEAAAWIELARVRRQGWALSEQQMELNYRGIAVPLLDRNNAVHGAISITMPINQENTEDAIKRVLPVLQEVARSLRPLI